MRAKDENSSTMRPMSPTWRMIVSVHWSKTSRSSAMTLPNFRRSRSAESWIGVSGFLISWAMRRATSAQAELRCADDEVGDVVEGDDIAVRAGRSRRSVVTRTLMVRSRPPRMTVIWSRCSGRSSRSAAPTTGASSGRTSAIGRRSIDRLAEAEEPQRRAVGDGDAPVAVDADDAGGDAREHRLGEAPAAVDLLARREQLGALARGAARSWC